MHIYFEVVSHKDTMFKNMVSIEKKKDFVKLIILEHADEPVKENVLVDPRRNFLQFVSNDNVLTFIRATSDDDRMVIDIKGVLFELQEQIDSMGGEYARPTGPELSRNRKHQPRGHQKRLPIKEVSLSDFLSAEEIAALDSIFYKDTDRLMPSIGEIYKNRHGKLFSVIAVSHWAKSDEMLVTYRAMQQPFDYTTIPLDVFMSKINKKKHPQVKQTYSFELVDFWG